MIWHATQCHLLTTTSIRFFDMLRWFKRVPRYFHDARNEVARYYHKEAQLRVQRNEWESQAGLWVEPLSHVEQHAATGPTIDATTNMDSIGFGLETNPSTHVVTVGDYDPPASFANNKQELNHVIAAFQTHWTRLVQQDVNALRFRAEPNFLRSLDHSFLAFTIKLMAGYTDQTGAIRTDLHFRLVRLLYNIQVCCGSILNRRDSITALMRQLWLEQQPLIDLQNEEVNEQTSDERLLEIEEELPEVLEGYESAKEDLQAQMQPIIMITVAENPYSTAAAAS